MSFTNDGEGQALNRIFTTTTMKQGGITDTTAFVHGTTDFYISLHESSPGETGATTSEVAGPVGSTSYERKVITFTALTAEGNQISNTSPISWSSIGATWRSGNNIGHFGIHLGATGEMLCYGSFTGGGAPATSGDTVTIAAGAIDITLD